MATRDHTACRAHPGLSRRGALGMLGAVSLVGLAGCGGLVDRGSVPRMPERASCVPKAQMETYDRLGAARLRYEVNETMMPVPMDPDFHAQLEAWWQEWQSLSGTAPQVVSNYGAWIPSEGACDSWHYAGRAFDFAQLRTDGAPVVSCRYDEWGSEASAEQLRRYWALAASLHLHFEYVLTYLYDTAHHNHIHIDNGRSGAGMSHFSGRSRVQNQAVQAICTHLWDQQVEVTSAWDRPTQQAVGAVTEQLGVRGRLTSQSVWQEFLRASVQRM